MNELQPVSCLMPVACYICFCYICFLLLSPGTFVGAAGALSTPSDVLQVLLVASFVMAGGRAAVTLRRLLR